MKVFRLYPNPDRQLKEASWTDGPVDPFSGYDYTNAAIVRAESEEEARTLMEARSTTDEMDWRHSPELWGDDPEEYAKRDEVYYEGIWTNENLVTCEELTGEGGEEIVMTDYRAG